MGKQIEFSTELHNFLNSKTPNTIKNLEDVFDERSFAIIYLLLMALPALPVPTGGISHVFEIVCMLVAIEQIIGLKTIWLPKKYRNKELPSFIVTKALPILTKRIEWLEKYSKIRGVKIISKSWFTRFTGLMVLVITLSAFLAPPFSGLDTIPALGVVLIAVGMIIEDIVYIIAGMILGTIGVILNITIGAAVFVYAERFVAHATTTQRYWFFGLILTAIFAYIIYHFKSKNKKH